jgi:hypothetical protein
MVTSLALKKLLVKGEQRAKQLHPSAPAIRPGEN